MKPRRTLLVALIVCVLFGALSLARGAESRGAARPDDFTLLTTSPGVEIYENEDGSEIVQVIDLRRGARLELWHGQVSGAGPGKGIFGGNSPQMSRHYLPDVWQAVEEQTPDAVCLANGGYFRDTINGMWVDPTELAFPLKKDGVLVSEGYEMRRFRREREMLELWSSHAKISPLSRTALYTSTAPDILAGLDETAWIRATEPLGRTLVGVGDRDGDTLNEVLYVYSGAEVTQSHAVSVLRAFGANDVMMLDGGGSNQLICYGYSHIKRIRPLPQMIVTVAAPATQPVEMEVEPFWELLQENLARLRMRLCCGRQ